MTHAQRMLMKTNETIVKVIGSRLMLWLTVVVTVVACGAHRSDAAEIYVTSFSGNFVGKYALDGTVINASLITSGLSNPTGIKLGPDGFLYVSNRGSGNIGRFATDGTGNPTYITGLTEPFGIDFDGFGNMYVASYQSTNSVRKYAPDGTPINMEYVTGLPQAEGLAFDPAGNLYVSDFGLGTVSKYSPTGTLINASFVSGLSNPTAIAIDANFNLFVSQYGGSRVGKYDASTQTFTTSFLTGITEPEGIVINADGTILTASLNGSRVQKFSASGGNAIVNPFISLGSNAYAMTGPSLFVPVPEPSSLLQGCAGVAGLALSIRRRLRRKH